MEKFVKVLDYNLRNNQKPYEGCVLKVIDEYPNDKSCVDVNGYVLKFWNEQVMFVEKPANIEDQICYKPAEGFQPGDYVLDKDENVYRITAVDGCMLRCMKTTEQWSSPYAIRFDKLTKIDRENEDLIAGWDYITEEPIFTYDEDHTLTIHGFNRYGSATDLGEILPYNVNDEARVAVCNDCDEVFDREDDHFDTYMHYIEDGDYWICESCWEDNWTTCDACGYPVRTEDACWDEDNDRYLCEHCYDSRETGKFHDYCYKPRAIFHRKDGGDYSPEIPFMGVELEMDSGDKEEAVKDLYALSEDEDLFYMKHDGSLGYSGIELVTHPCDLDYHLTEFPWDNIASAAMDNGYKSHNTSTCGLHVHVSRSAFGDNRDAQDLTIAKIIILVDRFWDELVNFSRRNIDQLEHWAKKPEAKIYSYDTEDVAVTKAKNSGSHDRYKAVNLTNANTVEFRLFKGTLKVDTIKATLEFLSNLLAYAKETALIDVQEAKWKSVALYKEYPELLAYLETRNLLDVPDKPKPVEPKQVKARFRSGDFVWFQTSNTDDQPMRGIVQNVFRDEENVEQPLYVVVDTRDRINFLIDDEIFSNEEINRLEESEMASAIAEADMPV